MYIIRYRLEMVRKKKNFLCQENLTKLFRFWHDSCCVVVSRWYYCTYVKLGGAGLAVSPLVARVYVKFFVSCISVQYPPKRVGIAWDTAEHMYSLPIAQSLV